MKRFRPPRPTSASASAPSKTAKMALAVPLVGPNAARLVALLHLQAPWQCPSLGGLSRAGPRRSCADRATHPCTARSRWRWRQRLPARIERVVHAGHLVAAQWAQTRLTSMFRLRTRAELSIRSRFPFSKPTNPSQPMESQSRPSQPKNRLILTLRLGR
jgi:hypothetical protein